jgi:hypothetical protein
MMSGNYTARNGQITADPKPLVDRQLINVNGISYQVITRRDGSVTYTRIGR